MADYKHTAGQKHRLTLDYDAMREVVAQAGSEVRAREEMEGELGANNLAHRVASPAAALGRFGGMSRPVTSSWPSNHWGAKDAEVTFLRSAGRQSSAPLTPNR